MVQQHIRALKAMGHEPPGPFVTSVLELKLDQNIMFEWQKQTQSSTSEIPHYRDLLEFLSLRAQASESSVAESGPKRGPRLEARNPKRYLPPSKAFAYFAATADVADAHCILCTCVKFKALSHYQKLSTLRE